MSGQPQYRPDRTMWNPVQVEAGIHEVAGRIGNSVGICGALYGAFLEADRVFDFEFAKAYLAATGTVNDRKYRATVNTIRQREDRDVADAAFKLADRRSRAQQEELRALQSIGATIRSQYGVAGRGEGP